MKRKKRILSVLLCLIACFGLSITAYAALFYEATYTNGKQSGAFTVTATSSVVEYSVQTQDFDSDSLILIDIYDSQGRRINGATTVLVGNQTRKNEKLVSRRLGDTFTIKYQVSKGSGWIGVWMF